MEPSTMGIELDFIDFIVPVHAIRSRYPGGWGQCLRDHADLIGSRVWYDDYLFRLGPASRSGVAELLEGWEDLGFAATTSHEGQTMWNDLCVLEFSGASSTYPCDWLEIDAAGHAAHLAGQARGRIVGRSAFRRRAPARGRSRTQGVAVQPRV